MIFSLYVGDFYFQPISPNPTTIKYLDSVNITFVLAQRSDGTFNRIGELQVLQYNAFGNFVGSHTAKSLGSFSQTYYLELDQAGVNTAGNYTISMYANL